MRLLPLTLSVLLIAYAVIELWLVPANGGTASASWFCRNWFCEPDSEVSSEYVTFLDATRTQATKSIDALTGILERDPASAYRWCDLGEFAYNAGDVAKASYCFSRALPLAPNSSPILLRYVNFDASNGDIAGVLKYSRQILLEISDYDTILFSTWDRLGLSIEQILGEGLPADKPPAAQSYLRHLFSGARVGDTARAWTWMNSHGFADDTLTGEYVSFLLRNHAYQQAQEAWSRELDGRRGDYPVTNLLYNGGFEADPLPSAFDWQISKAEGVQINRDDSIYKAGHFALKIRFEGQGNVDFVNVSQIAVLTQGRHRLTFWVKTDGITTDEGVHLRLADAENQANLNLMTANITGTTDWKQEILDFSAPLATHLVRVQVVRLPSFRFDNKISGTAWIDAVTLSP